jgi:hypothetical protein
LTSKDPRGLSTTANVSLFSFTVDSELFVETNQYAALLIDKNGNEDNPHSAPKHKHDKSDYDFVV